MSKLVVKMGDSSAFGSDTHEACVRIPSEVLHGCKVLSDDAHLFYITSMTYDPNEQGRFRFDSRIVPHNWGEGVFVVENDKRDFVPTSIRKRLA